MIEYETALNHVLARVVPTQPVVVPLANALFRRLAEDICSDIDAPPFDKSMMDGFAIRAADMASGSATLQIVGTLVAGETPQTAVGPGQAMRIMTGAMMPSGADAVVMREATDDPPMEATVVSISKTVEAGDNVIRKATNMAADQVVLPRGRALRANEVGVLAEVGRRQVSVTRAPNAAILATGNELVPVGQKPTAGKIRNSNGPMLCALARTFDCNATNLGIATDQPNDLREQIKKGLEHEILIISGGVSAGDLDLVPQTLVELGVEQVFHKVRMKPGKPVWFGVGNGSQLVFGLPGNPVSSFVCFHLFVRPAVRLMYGWTNDRSMEQERADSEFRRGRLVGDMPKLGDRRTFWPAREQPSAQGLPDLDLLPWKGSSDLLSLAEADCLVDFGDGTPRDDFPYVKI